MLYQIRSGKKDTSIQLTRHPFSNYTMSQGIGARNVKILGDSQLVIQSHATTSDSTLTVSEIIYASFQSENRTR